jgi:hypothetical protein
MILFFVLPPILVVLALAYSVDRRNRRRRLVEDEAPGTVRRESRTQQRNNRVMDPGVQSSEAMNHGVGGFSHHG